MNKKLFCIFVYILFFGAIFFPNISGNFNYKIENEKYPMNIVNADWWSKNEEAVMARWIEWKNQ